MMILDVMLPENGFDLCRIAAARGGHVLVAPRATVGATAPRLPDQAVCLRELVARARERPTSPRGGVKIDLFSPLDRATAKEFASGVRRQNHGHVCHETRSVHQR